MYDVPDFHLVDNPLDRYSIGDRTAGLDIGVNGSVTIYLQYDSPGSEKESNWLPAPTGKFRPILRAYQPVKRSSPTSTSPLWLAGRADRRRSSVVVTRNAATRGRGGVPDRPSVRQSCTLPWHLAPRFL